LSAASKAVLIIAKPTFSVVTKAAALRDLIIAHAKRAHKKAVEENLAAEQIRIEIESKENYSM
jgi:hypothetical protein